MTAQMPGLLDEIGGVPAPAPRPARRRPRFALPRTLKARWQTWMADPVARPRALWSARAAACLLVAGLALGAYFAFRPVPRPDYLNDPIDGVFNYTLLTDEFNKLPVQERLKLMKELVDRMKGLSSNDSVLLGAFAAGIAGAARDQLEANVSHLAIDTWDLYAKDYGKVAAGGRETYLDNAFLEFSKMMEAVGGRVRDVSDDQRLAEVRRDAARDKKNLSDPGKAPSGEVLGTIFHFMNGNVGARATPQQRSRGAQMMRDMTRHFRGQDIATGKPK